MTRNLRDDDLVNVAGAGAGEAIDLAQNPGEGGGGGSVPSLPVDGRDGSGPAETPESDAQGGDTSDLGR